MSDESRPETPAPEPANAPETTPANVAETTPAPENKPDAGLDHLIARGGDARRSAWAPSARLQEALQAMEAADEIPDPPAPDPVVLMPEKGGQILVADTEAAEAYVAPTGVRTRPNPRLPTGPVKIRPDVDPRRQKTQPSVRVTPESEPPFAAPPVTVSPSDGQRAAAPNELERAPERAERPQPSVHPVELRAPEPSKRDPGARRGRAWALPILVAMIASTLAIVVLRAVAPDSGSTSGAMSSTTNAATNAGSGATSASPSPAPSGASSVLSMGTSVVMTSPAPSASPSGSSSAKTPPKATEDPYADASAPKTPPPPAPTGAPSSGAPTALPSAAPTAPSTTPPPAPTPGSDIW